MVFVLFTHIQDLLQNQFLELNFWKTKVISNSMGLTLIATSVVQYKTSYVHSWSMGLELKWNCWKWTYDWKDFFLDMIFHISSTSTLYRSISGCLQKFSKKFKVISRFYFQNFKAKKGVKSKERHRIKNVEINIFEVHFQKWIVRIKFRQIRNGDNSQQLNKIRVFCWVK